MGLLNTRLFSGYFLHVVKIKKAVNSIEKYCAVFNMVFYLIGASTSSATGTMEAVPELVEGTDKITSSIKILSLK